MLCSPREFGFSDEASGLMILDPGAPIGMPLGELFPPDTIFDLEITPDRPDLLSYTGIARELSIIFQLPAPNTPAVGAGGAGKPVSAPAKARIEALEAWSFVLFDEGHGVILGPRPVLMRLRLVAAGLAFTNTI